MELKNFIFKLKSCFEKILILFFLFSKDSFSSDESLPFFFIIYTRDPRQAVSYSLTPRYVLPIISPENYSLGTDLGTPGNNSSNTSNSLNLDTSFTQDLSIPFLFPVSTKPLNFSFEKKDFYPLFNIPIYIEKIGEGSFYITLGDKAGKNICFTIKPEGIYNWNGEFEGSSLKINWFDKDYYISLSGLEGIITFKLTPLGFSNFTAEYKREFYSAGYSGELRVGFDGASPYLEINLKDPSDSEFSGEINEGSMQLAMNINIGKRDELFTISVEEVKIEEDKISGKGSITFDNGGEKIILAYKLDPKNSYLELTQSKDWDEIIDDFINELAEAFVAMNYEKYGTYISLEEMKKYFYHLLGKDRLELIKLIEEVNRQRQGLVVPYSISLVFNFSSPLSMETIIPIIPGKLALHLGTEMGNKDLSFLWSPQKDLTFEIGGEEIYAGDLLYLFRVADLEKHIMVGIEFCDDIESLSWNVNDLEFKFTPHGFSIGTSESLYIGSLMDYILSRDKNTSWRINYSSLNSWDFSFKIPLRIMGESKSFFLFKINKGEVDLGFRIPFVYGGMLEINKDGFEYILSREDIKLNFSGKNGTLKLELAIPPKDKL